jgi:UDP-N-acetylglucosamine--N-acetylmuramyl-(pentapeptide) pyrophosphoryl-undecaprenol N-acetylglucosamine transferase
VNRRLAPFARTVLASFASSRPYLRGARDVVVTGNPLREFRRVGREEAAERLGLSASRPTVLVIGGSRGAHSLNVAGADAAQRMTATRDVQFLMLAGAEDATAIASRFGDADDVTVMPYLEEVELAYALADVAVARAGASSVFELATRGIPTVFVPYPWAADDHQRRNAAELLALDACEVIDDAQLDGPRLAGMLSSLLDDAARRSRMSVAMREWAPEGAATRAASAIVEAVKKKPEIVRGARSLAGGGVIGLSR